MVFDYSWAAVFAAILLILVLKRVHYWKRIPPGPWGLPYIGSFIHLNKINPLTEFVKYKEKYGKIFSLSCGDFLVIVVNDFKMIVEMNKIDEFNGRPDYEAMKLRNMSKKNRGILFSDAVHSWSEQRRFSLRNLRDFGFGKQSLETLLIFELQQLISVLKECIGKPTDIANMFNASVLNTLWTILTGKRFPHDDPLFNKLMAILHSVVRQNTLFNPGLFFPGPAKYGLVKKGLWSQRILLYDNLRKLMKSNIEEHQIEQSEIHEPRDFLDSYLKQIKLSEPGSSFYGQEGINSLIIVMLDLFSAGVETTATTILFAMLFVSKLPEVQKKLQDEIDTIIGKDRLPCREDKAKMLYMEAFTNEVHRKGSILTANVSHKVMKDTIYNGYLFPEGAVLMHDLHGIHHDKEIWGDPENFRPERFLNESGTQLKKYEELIPFSTGKRICLGETLARDNLFLFLAGLLQAFSFELAPSSKDVDINSKRVNMVGSPFPFEVTIALR